MKSKMTEPALTLSASAFYRLVAQGLVVDGRAGGLIIGRTIIDGGVAIVRQYGESFHLQYRRAEDGDFVLRHGIKTPRLSLMPETEFALVFSQLLITNAQPDDKLLWLTCDQMIVPEELAKMHSRELAEVNSIQNPFLFCDLEEVFETEVR